MKKTDFRLFSVPPSSVSLESRGVELVVGTRVDIACHSWGSRPPAHITWYIRDTRLGELKTASLVFGRGVKYH